MKFKSPYSGPAPTSPGGGSGRPHGKPDWLKEWIANQGRFVLLSCGHIDDVSDRGALIIITFGGPRVVDVLCYRCDTFERVLKGVKYHEYIGTSPPMTPKEPMF